VTLSATVAPYGGPVLYAFALGLVAAVNPCGFPLLPAYLVTFTSGGTAEGWARRTARGLGAGCCVTAGFLVVFGALGLAVESGVRLVFGWVPWVMVPVGLALAGAGVLAVVGRLPAVALPGPSLGGRRWPLSMAVFGVAYAVASLSCALPLFLAAVAGSFVRLGPAQGAATAVAYALGMGLFVVGASLAVAVGGGQALQRARPLGRVVPRLAGLVLALVGAYLAVYWTGRLVDPAASPGPVRVVQRLAEAIGDGVAGAPRLAGVVLGLVVASACVALAWRDRRRGAARPEAPGAT
jgi:cytochrome c biogenesis protein CcdA